MGDWDDWNFYPPKKPARRVKGGIRAQSRRGGFGESWWARRWISVLESFDIGGRLARGRSYARNGQVMKVDVAAGKVSAKVQGSRPRPYEVTIKVRGLSESDWKAVAGALKREAVFAAKLLAGEMPQDIEKVFTGARLSLFPAKLDDLDTDCSCPDWSNPCKHIAAVYYLLGEEFDRDPFLIFKLRGKSREDLTKLLGAAAGDVRSRPRDGLMPGASSVEPREPISPTVDTFWSGGHVPADLFGSIDPPETAAALPKRLGKFPLWRGSEHFLDALTEIYMRSSARGLDVYAGSVSDE